MKFPKHYKPRGENEPRGILASKSKKAKAAVDAMIWEGKTRKQAAQAVGMVDESLRQAFTRPDVLAYYRQQLQVLRESEQARNIHRMIKIRDKAENMPAVNAAKWLHDQAESDGKQGNSTTHPGVTIIIEGDASARNVRATPESVTISTGSVPLRRELSPPSPLDEDATEPTPRGKNGPRSGRW